MTGIDRGFFTKRDMDPAAMDHPSVYKIMSGCIVPRPIGFLTTLGANGVPNAAPFSFFNMLSHIPPLVSVSISTNQAGSGPKDTLANIAHNGEFVVNVVDNQLVEAVDRCSESYPADVDEIAVSGLTAAPCKMLKPPRIDESPVNFECQLLQMVAVPNCIHTLVIGRVVWMHVREDILLPNQRIDQERLGAVGRMAGSTYCRTAQIFTLAHDGFAAVAAQASAHAKSTEKAG